MRLQLTTALLAIGLLSTEISAAQSATADAVAPADPRVLSGVWSGFPRGMGAGPAGTPAAGPPPDGMASGAGGPGGPNGPNGPNGMGAGPNVGILPVIKPEYAAQFAQNVPAPNQGELPNDDASRLCIPDAFFGSGGRYPTLIIQTAKQVTIINEENHRTRRIYLDRQHPKNLVPSYAGHSVGRWEGNTLVVNTIGLLNREGGVTPPGYYVEERFTRKNNGQQLEWIISFHSDAYATPGSKTITYNWRPDLHIQEQVCEEFSDNFNDSYKFK